MSTPLPTYLQCDPDVVCGLIGTVTAALVGNFPVIETDLEDIEMVLDVLRLMRPKVAELDTFSALLQMQRGHWDDATHILARVVASSPQFAYAKALLALCLSFKGDENWRQTAAEALQDDPDPTTRQLVRALVARDDLQAALRAHKNGAPFEVPMSIATLDDDDGTTPDLTVPSQQATLPEGSSDTASQQRYMRI